MNFRPTRPLTHLLIAAFFASTAASVQAELRTLTDTQGRSLQADVLAVEADAVKIKRADGQTFNLPLATLIEDDQKWLREWAEKQAKLIPANAIEITLGRAKFETSRPRVENVMRTFDDGSSEVAGTITTTDEDWGYSVTLANRLTKPIPSPRVEYVLFLKASRETGGGLSRRKASTSLLTLPARERAAFKTQTVRSVRTVIRGDLSYRKSGGTGTDKDNLHGIWMRIYSGDQLIAETSTPENLRLTEKWDAADTALPPSLYPSR